MINAAAMSVLQTSPIFEGIAAPVLAEIAGLCRNRSYRSGQTVFEESAPGTKLYGVIAGRLLITTTSAQGSELHLNVAEQGEIVGEIAFLDGGLRTATGRAAEPSTCFEIDRDRFFSLLQRHPQLSAHLLELVCKRVRWMTKLAADSAFLSVPQRLATHLRHLAKPATDGAPGVEVKISQAALADFLGVSRQVVNGHLQVWRREGRVVLKRGTIRILDIDTL